MWQIFMLTTLLALAGCKNGGGEYSQSVSEYATMQVAPVNKTLSTQYPAAIQGKQDIAIFPQVTGTITRLCVNEGQAVKRGQVLFIIDQVPYQAALATARANMEAADATLATAQLTYDSKKELFAQNVISAYELKTYLSHSRNIPACGKLFRLLPLSCKPLCTQPPGVCQRSH